VDKLAILTYFGLNAADVGVLDLLLLVLFGAFKFKKFFDLETCLSVRSEEAQADVEVRRGTTDSCDISPHQNTKRFKNSPVL
jgi:hypothetical protein